MTPPANRPGPVRVLISSCLLGNRVRFDGGHKRDRDLVESFGRLVEYVPVCPEVACGLPVPREPMELAGDGPAPRLLEIRTGRDHTGRMASWIRRWLRDPGCRDLCGYICKSGSPSCAMGRGIFTNAFAGRFPLLPVEDELGMRDPDRREAFARRLRAHGPAGRPRARKPSAPGGP